MASEGERRCSVCGAEGAQVAVLDGEELCLDCERILAWARRLLAPHRGLNLGRITPRTRFVEDLGDDSLDDVLWLFEAEAEFAVSVFGRTSERLRTIGDLIQLIRFELASRDRGCGR